MPAQTTLADVCPMGPLSHRPSLGLAGAGSNGARIQPVGYISRVVGGCSGNGTTSPVICLRDHAHARRTRSDVLAPWDNSRSVGAASLTRIRPRLTAATA